MSNSLKDHVMQSASNIGYMGLARPLLIALSVIMPINIYADYSGRHYNSSSADLLLIMAFIAIVVIAIVLFISGSNNRSSQQIKENATPKQNYNYVPKVDINETTLAILSVSSLEKQAKRSSYLRSFISDFSSMPSTQKKEIQIILNKGACDAAREYNGHLESDFEMNSKLFRYSSKEHEEHVKNENKSKRHFYNPPLNYSVYYDLAYDTVMSDVTIRYKIKHDIETGLIQC